MSELAALSIKISGDSADLQADLVKARTQIDNFEKTQTKATKSTTEFSGSLSKLGNVSGSTRAKIQNTSFQLQDIAVQLQSGTKASTTFAQQLPQLLGGFGALGAVLGVLAGVGIPILAFAFRDLSEETDNLEGALKRIEESMGDLQTPFDILSMSADDLAEKYGTAAERVLQFSLAQAELAMAAAQSNLAGQVSILEDASTIYTRTLHVSERYRNSLNAIERDFGLAAGASAKFGDMLLELNNAETFEGQQAALEDMLSFLEAEGVDLTAIPEAFRTALQELILLSNETDRAKGLMEALQKVVDAGGGGDPDKPSSGGRKRTNPLIGDLEKLREGLLTQEEAQIASFERQQETLQNALNQQLLTRQEYNELMQEAEAAHSDKMAQLAVYQYGSTLQQTGRFMGDMAAVMQGGNDKMLRIAKVFGAAEALINSYRAYNQVIADPSLPWFAKIPAAVSVLGAGLGMVNAIKGVSSGGGAAAGGGAAGASGQAGASAAPQTSNNVAISLQGGDMFSRGQVIQLINSINDAVDDGAQIRLV